MANLEVAGGGATSRKGRRKGSQHEAQRDQRGGAKKKRAKSRGGPAGARRRGSSPTQPSAEAQGRCLKGAVFCADAGLRNATAHNAFQRRQSLLGAALPCAGEDDEGDWAGDWGRATSDEIPPH